MKTNIDKKVNKTVKKINNQLKADVFGNRFWIRQYRKSRVDGISYYLYELCDRKQPFRNKIIPGWLDEFEILTFNKLDIEINKFIVSSDFWKK
jgi:hypothetical protein